MVGLLALQLSNDFENKGAKEEKIKDKEGGGERVRRVEGLVSLNHLNLSSLKSFPTATRTTYFDLIFDFLATTFASTLQSTYLSICFNSL